MQAKWLGVKEASKNLGISQATLWNLKNTLCLDAGKHWIYVTGKKNSNVLFNIVASRFNNPFSSWNFWRGFLFNN